MSILAKLSEELCPALTVRQVLKEDDGLWFCGDEHEVHLGLGRLLRSQGPDQRPHEQVLLLVHANGHTDQRFFLVGGAT